MIFCLEKAIIQHSLIQILNFLLLKIIVNNIFIDQPSEYPFPLSPPIINDSLSFNWYEPRKADDECFIRKSVHYQPNNVSLCLGRSKYKNLMTCGIGISPSSVNESRILVIGSTGVIGNSITSELARQNISFVEIRSHFQFNLNFKQIYNMLKLINISSIILLANEEIWSQKNFTFDHLWKFCEKKAIPVFQIVNHFNNSLKSNIAGTKSFKFDLFQIKSPPIWGPIFLTPHQRIPGNYFHQCVIGKKIPSSSDSTPKEYTFSIDIAKYVINDIVLKHIKEKKIISNKITIPAFPTISDEELRILLKEKGCSNTSNSPGFNISELNRQKFDIVWKSLQTEDNIGPRQKQKAYVTLVTCVSNRKRIIYLFSLSLQCTKHIINDYPNLAIEYLVLYCPTDDKKGKFYEVFDIPPPIKKFIRIIEIPKSYIDKLKKAYNITYFPEFIIKNIGIRRSSGEYIFSINSDVILPIGFYEGVQRKLFTPLSYIRSHRRMVNFHTTKQLLKYYYDVKDYRFMNQTYSNVCRNGRFYDDYDRNGCGDFQGSHRQMWFNIGGFIESNHVFHIDTALSLDFASLPTSLFSTIIGQNLHIAHEKESNQTDHFKFFNTSFKNAIKQGVSSSMIKGLKRPNWGSKGMTFVEY